MVDIGVTRVSSKGQVIIPADMRGEFAEGEKLILIKNGKQIIMKRAADFGSALEDDILFAKRTEKALRRYEKGWFRKANRKEFLDLIKRW